MAVERGGWSVPVAGPGVCVAMLSGCVTSAGVHGIVRTIFRFIIPRNAIFYAAKYDCVNISDK